ncbi:hypothetical protein AGMMS49928_20620 [Spirochaetia bacterium]|nr:hypothetical protein AGMMS49928_20620 [Spirochaetia bacterium]
MKRLPFPILVFLLILFPVLAWAQTPDPRPIAVMPFSGEEDEINQQFRDSVTVEIQALPGNFPPTQRELPDGADVDTYPADEPPTFLLMESFDSGEDGFQYAVTGQSFPDDGEHHLQVWLWDIMEPTLIYTDELVCEEIDEAAEYMTALIEWVFSHMPEVSDDDDLGDDEGEPDPGPRQLPPLEPQETIPVPTGRTTAPNFDDEDKWFYLGGRVGGGLRFYFPTDADSMFDDFRFSQDLAFTTTGRNAKSPAPGFSFEGGLHAAVQLLPFFAIQAEFIFTFDQAEFEANLGSDKVTIKTQTMSLMVPMMAKITFRPVPFLVAPYGGIYYAVPIGGFSWKDSAGGDYNIGTYTYGEFNLGWLGGITMGMKMDRFRRNLPGLIFFDLRYSMDMSGISVQSKVTGDGSNPLFSRGMLTLSFGYEIGFVNRDIKTNTRR